MIVYRISNSLYSNDLSGSGSAKYGGRWNSKGHAMLYTSEHISLAVLELVVNFNQADSPLRQHYHLIEIIIPDTDYIELRLSELKKDWTEDMHYSQYIGDEFLASNANLILKVPSAVVPEEHNFLINPSHRDFRRINIKQADIYQFDRRLIRS
jgi:RES domain-containing protein